MVNSTQVKRKHFRFPAYDDAVGVKLTPEKKRSLFQEETTSQPTQPMDSDGLNVVNKPARSTEIRNHSQSKKAELAKHKSNLPKHTAPHEARGRNTGLKKKTSLFGSRPNRNNYDFRSKEQSAIKKTSISKNYSYDERSYFVPKYIPASVIPEEQGAHFTEEELMSAMKKNTNSYLLFDDEPADFQVKHAEEDDTVKKFNIPSESPEIPVTRRQYQQIKPDIERFGKNDISHTLPRSRKELKSAKENAKNQTAYGQKVAEAEQEKKRGILDKSLSGIIEDSSNDLGNSKYFN